MRILYIANHRQACSADDEGAIAHALRLLGHDVICIDERKARNALEERGDLVLFHKWCDPPTLAKLHQLKVFWHFDLVDCDDPTLQTRCRARIQWMCDVTPLVDLGFCTDGDWVHHFNCDTDRMGRRTGQPGKLHWLPQGADERVARRWEPISRTYVPILFTGIASRAGEGRASFVRELQMRYDANTFQHVSHGFHGADLGRLIARTHIVVAPDTPSTDRYWSNRVYMALGFGAFMLHPWCKKLSATGYDDKKEIAYYHGRQDLFKLIDHYLDRPAEMRRIADAGHARTLKEHLYRHRVEKLLSVVKDKLGVS